MAEPKKPSLTVLGGSMAGTKFLLPEPPASLLVGSDLSCHFQLEIEGVSPTHARLSVDQGGVTVHEGDGTQALYVNDNPVVDPTPLRNGDIIWLGSPGEADVVMLQCVLPPRPVPEVGEPAAIVPEPAPEPPPVEPTGEPMFVLEDAPAAPSEPTPFLPPEEPPSAPIVEEFPTEATVIMAEPAEEPLFPPEESPDETLLLPKPTKPTPAAEPAPPPPPQPEPKAPPAAASRPAPPAPTPARPRPTGSVPAAAPRRTTQVLPRPEPPAPRPEAKSKVGLYAALGVGGLLVLAGVGFAAWRFLGGSKNVPAPAITEAELRQSTTATPAPVPTPVATPEPPVEATPAPVEVASIPPPTPPAVQPSPSAAPTPALATPTPRPSPAASATPSARPSPRGAATPPPPSAEVLRGQQIAGLLAQGESALGARQYDQAISHFDEILRLDPQNAKAAADRASAVAQRDGARRAFVAGRTSVRSEKAGGGGLVGFEGADVQAAAVQGRIEFEMTPPSGIRPGDAYSLKVYVVNEGKKAIKIVGVTVTTVVNGTGSGGAIAPRLKQLEPQQRALLGEISGVWKDGTTSWSTEAVISANKGDTLRNTLNWR